MKKIGILTINDYTNYGNRLQNYAVQEVLKEMGFKPITIINSTKISRENEVPKIERIFQLLRQGTLLEKLMKKLLAFMQREKVADVRNEKTQNLKTFTAKNIKETDFSISVESIPKNLDSQFDYFVTGSDQVWNPSFTRFSEIDFLTFAPREKRIAFSPSIAVSEIPEELKGDFKEWIEGMMSLSVREDAGADIIKRLTGREATVLLDPTMAVSREKWELISSESKSKPTKKYMCTYFLGSTYNKHKKDIKKIAKENELELVNLGSLDDLERYSIDPAEFLDFINSSEIMLTDSFHGAIFSIIFNRPFIVFDRIGNLPSMQSRIDTLLTKFDLEDRSWKNIQGTQDIFSVDFAHTEELLKEEKNRTMEYLRKSLNK